MKVYEKLTKARVELQKLKLKKTGRNQSMTYFELGDFLPAVNELCSKHGLFTQFTIVADRGQERAVLTVLNSSDPTDRVSFVSPTADVDLPRGQKIQGVGAKITYMRRYMMMIAFEIVESDIVDKINRELTDEVSDDDLELITNAKSRDELSKLYKNLEVNYTSKVLLPHFKRATQDLEEVKKEVKSDNN